MVTKYWIFIALVVVLLLVLYKKQEGVTVDVDKIKCKDDSVCPRGTKCNTGYYICL